MNLSLFISLLIMFMVSVCSTQKLSTQRQDNFEYQIQKIVLEGEIAQQSKKKAVYKEVQMYEIFYAENFKYDVYKVEKRKKKAKLYDDETHKAYGVTDVEYVVLKKSGKQIAEFEIGDNEQFAPSEFGFFSFLGGKEKQLLISQGRMRDGRHWIVDLYPKYKVIFDSANFGEGPPFISIIDIDNDGVYEVTMNVTAFDYFDRLGHVYAPWGTAVFRYNAKAGKYFLANKRFQQFLLADIEKEKAETNTKDEYKLLSAVLQVMLDYIYAAKEKDAWAFYEQTYNLSDKQRIRDAIKDILEKESVYRMLYSK